MKQITFLLLGFLFFSCSGDDTYTLPDSHEEPTSTISFTYNDEVIILEEASVMFGGPDSSHDLELHGYIKYPDVQFVKYAARMSFQFIEGEFKLEQIDFTETERLGEHSFTQHGYYARLFGELPTTGFTATSLITGEGENEKLTGTFSGTLQKVDGTTIQIHNGSFEASLDSPINTFTRP